MLSDYVRTKPFNHQRVAYRKIIGKKSYGLLMEPGTGKTLPVIGSIGYRAKHKGIRRVLVVCPSTVITEWELQLNQHPKFDFEAVILQGDAKKRRKHWASLKPSSSLRVVVNSFENIRIMEKEIARWKPEMIVIDESQHIKKHTSIQSRAASRLGKKATYRIIMTGTPWHESPLDLYSQFRFLKPDLFDTSFTNFRDFYANMDYMGYSVKSYKHLDQLSARIAPYVFIKRKADCLELPGYVDKTIKVEMTNEQIRVYDKISDDYILETERDGSVPLPLVITRLIKQQQVTGGFTKYEDQTTRLGSSKIEALRTILESIPLSEKVIIFCKFIEEIKQISELLYTMDISHVKLYGGTKDKAAVIRAFQIRKARRAIICQIKTGGAGVTLTEANHTIYFSKSHSYLDYDQSRARNYRPGQDRQVTYYHLLCEGTVDELIEEAVNKKWSTSEVMHRYMHDVGSNRVMLRRLK